MKAKELSKGCNCIAGLLVALALCPFASTQAELSDFVMSGDMDWYEQSDDTHDGNLAWRSGPIGYYQTTCMSKTLDCPSSGTLTFYWKVSSSYSDSLVFYIDGELQSSISGSYDWTSCSYRVDAGTHEFKWAYSIYNSYYYYYSNYGLVDEIRWEADLPDGFVRVSFNPNKGACALDSSDIEIGARLVSLPTPTREGCRFLGWFTQKTGGQKVSGTTTFPESATLWAHWEPKYTWSYTAYEDGTARLDGVTPKLEGIVTLPDSVDGHPITEIAANAFDGHDELTELTVSEPVTNIRYRAFANSAALTRVVVPATVTHVDSEAFAGCYAVSSAVTPGWFRRAIPSTALTNVVVVAGTETIDAEAFRDCANLTSVTIPDSVRAIGVDAFSSCSEDLFDTTTRPGLKIVDGWVIGYVDDEMEYPVTLDLSSVRGVADGAFDGCWKLVRLKVPATIPYVGRSAFRNCRNLESVDLQEGVVSIAESGFSGCVALGGFTLPNSLRNVGPQAFYGCTNVLSLVIPANVTNIANEAFAKCSGIENVAVLATNAVCGANVFNGCTAFREATISQFVLDKTLQIVFSGAYQAITNIHFAAGVTNVGNDAFANCSGLPRIALPDEVMGIGNRAFANCTSLTNFSFSTGVSVGRIGESAFENCGFEVFSMPTTVTNVLANAFRNCAKLKRVTTADIGAWSGIQFANREANPAGFRKNLDELHTDLYVEDVLVQELTVPEHLDKLGSFTFVANTNLTSVVLLPGLTEIGNSAFLNCVRLESATLSEGLLSIGGNAFGGCEKLDNLIIPASVTEILGRAFRNCTGLTHLTLMETSEGIENNTRIGDNAFEKCESLTTVTIPSRVTTFGSQVFFDCEKLKSIYYLGEYAPILENGATDIYRNTPTVMLTYVMNGSAGWVDGSTDLPTVWPNNPVDGRGIRVMPKITCAVSFDANGGTESEESFSRQAGELLGELPMPARKGYRFDGWYTAQTGGAKVSDNSVVTANVALYAHWTLLPIYDVLFDANGGEGTVTLHISEGERVDTLPTASRYGYVLTGWWTQMNGGSKIGADTVISNNVSFWAQWQKAVYTVTLNGNGVAETSTRKIEHGRPVGALPELAGDASCTFDGWWTAAEGGTQLTSATTIYSDMTFWAHWKINSYVVTFDTADGAGRTQMRVNHGATLGTLPTPSREGFRFDGWWTSAAGGSAVTASTVITGATTFWAHWKELVVRLYEKVEGLVDVSAASIYNGRLVSVGGEVVGTVLAKVAKPKNDIAKVNVTVQIVGQGKKVFTGTMLVSSSALEATAGDGSKLSLEFGTNALSGKLGSYLIDGAKDLFASKIAAEKVAAADALSKCAGSVNIAWKSDGGWNGLTATVAAKGKVKVTGSLADGTKVSTQSQLAIGYGRCCVPVVYSKKSVRLAFALWLPLNGGKLTVVGLGEGVISGRPGALPANASFRVDAQAVSKIGLPGRLLDAYLPNGVHVSPVGAKWNVPKAGRVGYLRGTMTVDENKTLENPAALKLSYKAKDGTFKGSFKAYVDNGGKLKATAFQVTGVVVGGIGYGTASVRNVGGVPITVE